MKKFLVLFLVLFSSVALSQSTFYHCTKDGKKIISDQPCADLGAKETRQVKVKDMPPVNTVSGMSQSERSRTVESWQHQRMSGDRQSQSTTSRARLNEEEEKVRRCADLAKQKNDVAAQQRQRNNSWLNDLHRFVNDKIFEFRCGM